MRSPLSGSWSTLQTIDMNVLPLPGTATAVSDGGRTVLVTSLEPYSAYEFRTVAQRGPRSSAPSKPTDPLLPGPSGERVREAPVVEATSSASYRISWARNGGSCRPQISWDLMVLRPAADGVAPLPTSHAEASAAPNSFSSGYSDVRILASTLVNVSIHEEFGLRCPSPGCAFRLHATNVNGFEGTGVWTAASAVVPTNTLPAAPPGWARFEARLRPSTRWSGNAADFVRSLGSSSPCARDGLCRAEKLMVREIYGRARYVIFDALVQPLAASSPTSPAHSSALSAVQQQRAVLDALVEASGSLDLIDELALLPPAGADAAVPYEVLYHRPAGGIPAAWLLAGGGLLVLVAVAVVLVARSQWWIGPSWRRSGRTRGGARHKRLQQAADDDDFLEHGADGPSSDESAEPRASGRPRRRDGEGYDSPHYDDGEPSAAFADVMRGDAKKPQQQAAPKFDGGRWNIGDIDWEDDNADDGVVSQPPAAGRGDGRGNIDGVGESREAKRGGPAAPPASRPDPDVMPLTVRLGGADGTDDKTLSVPLNSPLAPVKSTEDLLQAVFDTCAETVGAELEATDSKQILLRYVTATGKERKLNTKVPWEDLRQAVCVVITLQPRPAAHSVIY